MNPLDQFTLATAASFVFDSVGIDVPTVAPYAYQDMETSHLAYLLSRVFEDADWKVLRLNCR